MYMKTYLKNAFKLIKRDRILIAFAAFIIYMGIVLKLLLPWLNNYLELHGFLPSKTIMSGLSSFYPVILSNFILFTGAVISGAIFGFLILTEKDESTLKAMLVTPISPKQYILSRIVASFGVAFIFIIFLYYVINLDLLPFVDMVLISLGGATTAPLAMLFLSILANSKLQGLNYAKVLSFLGFLIIISWFLKEPVQWIFGLFPPYWISKAYWTALEGKSIWYIYLFAGIVLQIAAIYFLSGQFIKRVYKRM